MNISKEDSVIDSIIAEVCEGSGFISIKFKNFSKDSSTHKSHVTHLITLAAQEQGITLHQNSINPIVLVTKDIKQYEQLVTLLFKYNYMSRYDWNRFQADVNKVLHQLTEVKQSKNTVSVWKKNTRNNESNVITEDIFDGESAVAAHPNRFFVASSSGSAPITQSSALLQSNERIPRRFLCPLSGVIMNDPVIFLRDQWTYERSAIEFLLKQGKVSTLSHQGLVPGDKLENVLIPNWIFKEAIDAFKEQHPELFNDAISASILS